MPQPTLTDRFRKRLRKRASKDIVEDAYKEQIMAQNETIIRLLSDIASAISRLPQR